MTNSLNTFMPVFWIIGTALGYAAVTYFITLTQESFKEGKFWKEAGAFVLYLAVVLILGRLVFRSAFQADLCALILAVAGFIGFSVAGKKCSGFAPALFLMSAACLVPFVLPIGQAADPDGTGAVRSCKYFLATLLMFVCVFAIYLAGYRNTENMFKKRSTRRKLMSLSGATVILVTGSVIFLAPFVWLLGTSFKESDQIMKFPPEWIPKRQISQEFEGKKCPVWTVNETGETVYELESFEDGTIKLVNADKKEYITETTFLTKVTKPGLKWENYPDALDFLPKSTKKGLVYLLNTVYVTLLSILGTLFSCSLVAYSFARLRWPGKDIIFALLLATMMLPGAVTMIPVFMIFKYLGWVDTLNPLWVPSFFGSAFAVFLMRQFFMSIPRDLEEAARLDGAGYFKTFILILMPLVKPALAALAIMTFMGSWNNFMGALIYINSPEKMTLAYGLQLFMGEAGIEYGMLMAASVLVILPVLIIFFFAQKHFIEGITLTGIKG